MNDGKNQGGGNGFRLFSARLGHHPGSFLDGETTKDRRNQARAEQEKEQWKGQGDGEELARQFVGKECIIYTVTSTDSSIQGTVKDVTDGGIVLEKDGNVEAVNLEYVTRIREYPRNAKGKRKTIVF